MKTRPLSPLPEMRWKRPSAPIARTHRSKFRLLAASRDSIYDRCAKATKRRSASRIESATGMQPAHHGVVRETCSADACPETSDVIARVGHPAKKR